MAHSDSWHFRQCLGQRSSQDSHAVTTEISFAQRPHAGTCQLALMAWLWDFICGIPALCCRPGHPQLDVAHPCLTAGAKAAVAMLSVLFFGEPSYWTMAARIVTVIPGIALISARMA